MAQAWFSSPNHWFLVDGLKHLELWTLSVKWQVPSHLNFNENNLHVDGHAITSISAFSCHRHHIQIVERTSSKKIMVIKKKNVHGYWIYIYIQLELLEFCTRIHCIRIWGARFQDGLYIFSYSKHIVRWEFEGPRNRNAKFLNYCLYVRFEIPLSASLFFFKRDPLNWGLRNYADTKLIRNPPNPGSFTNPLQCVIRCSYDYYVCPHKQQPSHQSN
jgi:hypothetical protein